MLSLLVCSFVALILAVPLFYVIYRKFRPDADDFFFISLIVFLFRYRKVDFAAYMKSHRSAFSKARKSGEYVDGVCNYFKVMQGLMKVVSGPFWHFVPMTKGKSCKECHKQFHDTLVKFLSAKSTDRILELGCGYGGIAREVAKISGASVTGITVAQEEIDGGTDLIQEAGLEVNCKLVQGNYHKMPFERESFDKAFCIYSLKYSANLVSALTDVARVLRKGGRFVLYEIMVTEKFDWNNKQHRHHTEAISFSSCMPQLHTKQAFCDSAQRVGLKFMLEADLGRKSSEGPWYSCFERHGVLSAYSLLKRSWPLQLVKFGESSGFLGRGCTDFFEHCIAHPITDYVDAGRMGLISGVTMMVWEKK